MSLRDSVFKLCNIIKKNEEVKDISNLITSLNTYKDKQKEPDRSRFGYIARHSRNQFYGYLFTDENIEDYTDVTNGQLIPLSAEERKLIEIGHATILHCIDEFMSDIKKNFPDIYKAIHPYDGIYKEIKPIKEKSLLSKEELSECVSDFKACNIYKKIISSPTKMILKQLPGDKIDMLVGVINNEIEKSTFDIVSDDIHDYVLRKMSNRTTTVDVLMQAAILLVSLREILKTICQLIFTALTGKDLIVLNNDNIINITKSGSNSVYSYMSVLTQDILIDCVTCVALIDCNPIGDTHIHKFARIHGTTISFNREEGHTSKLSLIILDENLNPLFGLSKL